MATAELWGGLEIGGRRDAARLPSRGIRPLSASSVTPSFLLTSTITAKPLDVQAIPLGGP